MNTTELKKLASAATPGPWVQENGFLAGSNHEPVVAARLGLGLGADAGDGRRKANGDWIRAANPAAILKLLAINAELVEALKKVFPVVQHEKFIVDSSYGKNFSQERADKIRAAHEAARAALAKAEGGEL